MKSCQHANWSVRGGDRMGYGHCADCDASVPIDSLLNADRARTMQAKHLFTAYVVEQIMLSMAAAAEHAKTSGEQVSLVGIFRAVYEAEIELAGGGSIPVIERAH